MKLWDFKILENRIFFIAFSPSYPNCKLQDFQRFILVKHDI